MINPLNFTLLLGSTSPRRIELMTQAGLTFTAVSPTSAEVPRPGESPRTLVKRLAREKAESVLEIWSLKKSVATGRSASRRVVIVAADTIVISPNGKTILGKPVDPDHAAKMLKSLSGKAHTVFTGYCILMQNAGVSQGATQKVNQNKPIIHSRVVSSKVKIRLMSTSEIRAYVATREPMDKAGSYAAQGIGMCLVESIRGSYTNVVGLPMAQLLEDLNHVSGISVFSR